MFVSESVLPDSDVFVAFHLWRQVVPTARRLVVAHWERFLERRRAAARRPRQGQVRRLPADAARRARRGVPHRGLPSCSPTGARRWRRPRSRRCAWSPTAPDALTLAIRDFLDRMGMPNRVHDPDSDVGREILGAVRRRADVPARRRRLREASIAPTSVRDVAAAIYGRPEDVDVDTVVDLCIVGAGPAGLAAAVYGASEGLSTVVRRGRGDRRPGRHQLDDPQLPRLPARHLRHAAGAAGPQPGDPVRHPLLHRLGGHRRDPRRRRPAARRPHRRRRRARPGGRRRHRRRLPQAAGRGRRGAHRPAASTTAAR